MERNARKDLDALKGVRARNWNEVAANVNHSLQAERALQVVDIVKALTEEEINLLNGLKHPIISSINIGPAKDIRQKYNLSIRELREIIYYI